MASSIKVQHWLAPSISNCVCVRVCVCVCVLTLGSTTFFHTGGHHQATELSLAPLHGSPSAMHHPCA
eukprot:1159958-Pelagomonas_calceolata.AAC.14